MKSSQSVITPPTLLVLSLGRPLHSVIFYFVPHRLVLHKLLTRPHSLDDSAHSCRTPRNSPCLLVLLGGRPKPYLLTRQFDTVYMQVGVLVAVGLVLERLLLWFDMFPWDDLFLPLTKYLSTMVRFSNY